ncbi:MAG: dipeptide ABC transporter ATP-binding protein [Alphaproteobacteria bacterium]|jgi:peptide/nickel transport system ATP-binding protein|nr:dipeptide ABC transporter ATP-binding protein [Alphaproteobacteria bacterium]
MAGPVLAVDRLSVELPAGADRRYAVEDLDLDVQPREIVCVVGESGSGKSVTAYTCMGLLPKGQLIPVAGSIELEGEEILHASTRRLRQLRGDRMAMVFQEPMTALNPVQRCGDQIDEVLRIHTRLDRREREARILDVLHQVHLPEPGRIARSFPHQLSGGQRQRIMIAMALVLEPALLIADEPTTALDVTTQAQILKLVRELQDRHGTGVLFITHDFGVVAEIADRVVVMRQGRVVESGPAEAILRRPEHAYTRMLIDAVPSLTPHPTRARGGTPVLATTGLQKTYRSGGFFGRAHAVPAVKGVDLRVDAGEIVGIVGESGSGKSTVARCIARLIDPTAGEILIKGHDVATLSTRALHPHRRRIQIVFQDPYRSLNPRRTVGASLIEGPVNYGEAPSAALARAREMLGFVGVDATAIDRYPHQFSGGQRQRICIARALLMEPEILIADEAVSALDVSVQAQVLDLLERIRERLGLAVLFITHDLRVAAQICDRVAVMRRGEVVESGPTFDVFQNPHNSYTRTLIKAAPGRSWSFQREAS